MSDSNNHVRLGKYTHKDFKGGDVVVCPCIPPDRDVPPKFPLYMENILGTALQVQAIAPTSRQSVSWVRAKGMYFKPQWLIKIDDLNPFNVGDVVRCTREITSKKFTGSGGGKIRVGVVERVARTSDLTVVTTPSARPEINEQYIHHAGVRSSHQAWELVCTAETAKQIGYREAFSLGESNSLDGEWP